MGSGDRPGHTWDTCIVPSSPDVTNAAPKACFCLLVIFTWNPASGRLRTSVADWLENSSVLPKKKIINRYSKISRYSAPLRKALVSHQLSAQSSSKSCYIVSQLQDYFSAARQRQPLGYPLIRPDAGGSLTWSWQRVLNVFSIRFKQGVQHSPRTIHQAAVLLDVQCLMPSVL